MARSCAGVGAGSPSSAATTRIDVPMPGAESTSVPSRSNSTARKVWRIYLGFVFGRAPGYLDFRSFRVILLVGQVRV